MIRNPRLRAATLWLVCVAAVLLLVSGGADAGHLAAGEEPIWQSLHDGLPGRVQITSLAIDPRNDRRLFAGTTQPDGLWLSDDGGLSGHFANGPLAGRVVYSLLIDPDHAEEILAGTGDGLFRSDDAGQTWQRDEDFPLSAVYGLARDAGGGVLAGGTGSEIYRREAGVRTLWRSWAALPGASSVVSLAASPAGGLILAGTDDAGLFRSRDGGRTWDNVSEIGPTRVAGLAFAGRDGLTAFARTPLGLYATADGGESWRREASGVPGYVDALLITGQDDVYLATSEGPLYRRAAGDRDWQPWGTGIGRPVLVSKLLAAPGTRWYAGTNLGLYLSDDAGLTWRLAQPGPGRPLATALAMTADGALLVGNNDGVFRSEDGGHKWERSSSGLPVDIVAGLAPAPGQPNLVYAALAYQGLYRSEDGGRHWAPTGWKAGTPAVLMDPGDPRHLFIRVAFERVYESRDGGATWGARWEGFDLSTQIISLAMDPGRPSTLYAGGTEGFFRSLDGAAHWQNIGRELHGQTIFTVVVDPREERVLYAGATNGVYRSPNGGERWERWGQGLEDVTVTALAFSPHEPRLVFAGTKYRGVYRSDDGGGHWQYAGLEPPSVNALLVTPDGRWLYAASAAGVYRIGVGTR